MKTVFKDRPIELEITHNGFDHVDSYVNAGWYTDVDDIEELSDRELELLTTILLANGKMEESFDAYKRRLSDKWD